MDSSDGAQWPRQAQSTDYLQKHKILELFNNLTAQLIYHQPSAPKEFLAEQLDTLIKSRTTRMDYPCLFDESNITSVFSILDPTARGYITVEQYREALKSLGVPEFDADPAGSELNKITMDTFMREAKLGLAKASSTFSPK